MDDSAYTNAVARLSLQSAIEAALATDRPAGANWSKIAAGLVLPFNEVRVVGS